MHGPRVGARLPAVSRTLRLLVAWLMLLALPLQGWAAATMLGCGQQHAHAAAAAAQHADHHADHAHPAHAAAHGHADEGAHADGAGSCASCAACMVGLALPAASLALADPPVAGEPRLRAPPAPVSFVTGGPDRPPRTVLA